MEYIYSAMLLHSVGKKITAENVKKVLIAAGIKADDGRIKALVASLDGVNIEEAVKTTAIPTAATAAPAAVSAALEKPEATTEKKEEKKKKVEKEVSEDEAAAGLSALFD